MNIAVVFAGGSGVRMGAGIPKQFLEVNGKPIIIHTLQLFQHHRKIGKIYVSVLKDYIPYMEGLVKDYHLTKVAGVFPGGETSQDTIYNTLKEVEKEHSGDDIVLLHDGVRPLVSYDVISENIKTVKAHGNAITSTACYETIVKSEDGQVVTEVPKRKVSYAVQAPQSFYLKDILAVHDKIRQRPERYDDMVDSCTMLHYLGIPAHLVAGNRGNIKVTTPEDVFMFRSLLQYRENEQAFGFGLTNPANPRLNELLDLNKEDETK